MAVSLAGAPVVYPWYLLWPVPFLQSTSTLPLMIWTLSILSVFFVWYPHAIGQPWQVPGWILLLEYESVAAAATVAAVRQPVHQKPGARHSVRQQQDPNRSSRVQLPP